MAERHPDRRSHGVCWLRSRRGAGERWRLRAGHDRHPTHTPASASRSSVTWSNPKACARGLEGADTALLPGAFPPVRYDFVEKDAEAARNFGNAAAAAGLSGSSISVVWAAMIKSCLITCDLGARWRSCSARAGVPVTVLRAAIVIGHGGISWEITRQLVAHLPAMVVPNWATTRTQPIALADVIRYLLGVLEPEAAKAGSSRSADRRC